MTLTKTVTSSNHWFISWLQRLVNIKIVTEIVNVHLVFFPMNNNIKFLFVLWQTFCIQDSRNPKLVCAHVKSICRFLVYHSNECIDIILMIPCISRSNRVVALLLQASWRGTQLEWPKEVICFLEMRANRIDFMNEILDTNDPKFS